MSSDEDYGMMGSEEEEEEVVASSSDDTSEGEKDFGLDDSKPVGKKPVYKVLKGQTLEERRKQALEEVTGVLGISEEDAARVLRRFKWDVTRVHEEWFTDVDAVRASVGMRDEAPPSTSERETCMICFEEVQRSEMLSAACKHSFCRDCWQGYTSTAIADGPACLDLRCPLPKCGACVPTSIIRSTAQPDLLPKFNSFTVRSFVEDNRKLVWCVGRGCECAVESCVDRTADEPLDVMCTTCGATFCFSCKEEAHRPVSCEWVRKWVTKNSAESENVHWIMANTKPCPRCSRPIEKNQGCMHMTCSQCRFEFCWLCQGDWKDHGDRTGGFFNCNRYDVAKRKGDLDEETRKRDNAKQMLERYMHYFERWDAHQKARNKAKLDQTRVSAEWLERLSEQTKTPTSQLKFIIDAWAQIIECRRVLSWTYTYGYYALDEMGTKASTAKEGPSNSDANNKFFFEFLQADAERSLERLHEAAEVQLKKVMENNSTAKDNAAPVDIESFMHFRTNLIGLTDVTRGYFEKLVGQLERGFEDLERDFGGGGAEAAALEEAQMVAQQAEAAEAAARSKAAAAAAGGASTSAAAAATAGAGSSRGSRRGSATGQGRTGASGGTGAGGPSAGQQGGGSSAGGGTEGGGAQAMRRSKRTRGGAGGGGAEPASEGGGGGGGAEGMEEDEQVLEEEEEEGPERMMVDDGGVPQFWACPHCTFNNEEQGAQVCAMCNQSRAG